MLLDEQLLLYLHFYYFKSDKNPLISL